MRSSLRTKFLIPLIAISLIALSAAFLLKTFVISDFVKYVDGESQDRIQRTIAVLESRFSQHGKWEKSLVGDDLVWTLITGLEVRLYDRHGQLLIDTESAVAALPALSAERILETVSYNPKNITGEFVSYPLFYEGSEVGRIDVRLLHPAKELSFISSSKSYYLYTVAALGATVLILSFFAARRAAGPISEMSAATAEIAAGNFSRRVGASGPQEIVSLANSFNRMADKLEAQEKLRRRLVSSAAHELRTPLAIISGELEGMIDGVLPLSREGLQSMHDEAARLTAILNAVDELTRAEASTLNLNWDEIDLNAHLGAIVKRFERLFEDSGAHISLVCPDILKLCSDPDLLSQIIINLISNAHMAISAGGWVMVSAGQSGELIEITVSDNGCGIGEDDVRHVFERFYKGKGGGLGLGLAIVKELVTALGGSIDVKSSLGKGTEFLLRFPVQRG